MSTAMARACRWPGLALLACMPLAACTGLPVLQGAGTEGARVAQLFTVMLVGATAVWLLVVGLALYVSRARAERHGRRAAHWLIVGGGAVLPTLVLGALLAYGLHLMPTLHEPGATGDAVEIAGEQWWWRVRYPASGGVGAAVLANELRVPVGRRTELRLSSPDVIHSFWVPALAGKVDMIPGRTTRLVLEPTRAGVYRAACAEFCGTSHAFMELPVVAMSAADFERWRAWQARPAVPPANTAARRGETVFARSGCGACHAVRGTPAAGTVGPDLTHVGSRLSLAAGVLPNTPAAFRHWVARPHATKPGAHMPAFDALPPAELEALAHYLESLQ